jgi:hypothetical protein
MKSPQFQHTAETESSKDPYHFAPGSSFEPISQMGKSRDDIEDFWAKEDGKSSDPWN